MDDLGKRVRVDVWHNVLWARYKALVFTAMNAQSSSAGVECRFFQIADTEDERRSIYPVDLSWHDYPFKQLFKGSYSRIPLIKRVLCMGSEVFRTDAELTILAGYDRIENWVQAAVLKIRGRKVAVFCDSTILDKPQPTIRGIAKRLIFGMCSGVFCYSKRAAEYVGYYGVEPSRQIVGLQAPALPRDYDPSDAMRRRLAARNAVSDKSILFVGRLAKEKGVDLLLRAFQRLQSTEREARLTIVGSGPLKGELMQLAEELGIAKGVSFLEGIGFDELWEKYLESACFVLPSVSEPWGLVANEALSFGCPIIVSDACGCAGELAIPEKTGLSFESGSVEGLASALSEALHSFAETETVAKSCIDHAANFTPVSAARKIIAGSKLLIAMP